MGGGEICRGLEAEVGFEQGQVLADHGGSGWQEQGEQRWLRLL